jgi:hypothetical protein
MASIMWSRNAEITAAVISGMFLIIVILVFWNPTIPDQTKASKKKK